MPTLQGLDEFLKSLRPCALDESSLSIGRVKAVQFIQGIFMHFAAYGLHLST